jgi:5'-3' exonuclease
MLAYQVLVGDSTDNYPGCPGIGAVKANKLLDSMAEGESYVPHLLAAYTKAKLSCRAPIKVRLSVNQDETAPCVADGGRA